MKYFQEKKLQFCEIENYPGIFIKGIEHVHARLKTDNTEHLVMDKFCVLKSKGYPYKTENNEETIEGNTRRTLKKMRFHKYIY